MAGSAVVAFLIAAPVLAQDGAALYSQRCASCHEGGQVAIGRAALATSD
jgi:mono/diheme cytochrome c family protein